MGRNGWWLFQTVIPSIEIVIGFWIWVVPSATSIRLGLTQVLSWGIEWEGLHPRVEMAVARDRENHSEHTALHPSGGRSKKKEADCPPTVPPALSGAALGIWQKDSVCGRRTWASLSAYKITCSPLSCFWITVDVQELVSELSWWPMSLCWILALFSACLNALCL